MPSLYPHAQLLQIKPKEKLSDLHIQLKNFQEFYGANRLLQQAQNLIDGQDTQINEINKCINEVKKFIDLNLFIKEKLEQVHYLMLYIDFYYEANESQPIKSELDVQKNIMEEFKKNGFGNSTHNENFFIEHDSILINQVEELFKKIEGIYSEKELNPAYKNYFNNQFELIQPIASDQKNKDHFIFKQLYWLVDFLNQLEVSYGKFNELENNFISFRNNYLELCKELINSEDIHRRKNDIEHQFEILDKRFCEFDPESNDHEQLHLGLMQLDKNLNEISAVNQVELCNQQEKYTNLINLLIISKNNLTQHAEKLKSNYLWAKSGQKKSELIDNIQKKIDALLESREEQELSSSNQESFSDLKQTIGEAKAILSEYRGITFFRGFARLWGGGKVTSQLLVETLEEQVTDLQSHINRFSPSV